jgi:cytochrome P450
MRGSTPEILAEPAREITVHSRSPLAAGISMLRNPLEMMPPAIFHEPVVYARVGHRSQIFLADPVLIHEALVTHADILVKGEQFERILEPALGKGLLTADGAHWRWQRQSVSPAFRHDRIVGMLPPMIAAAETTRDRWLAAGPAPTLDIGHEMMRTTFDIIVSTMMSGSGQIDVDRVERSITEYLKATNWLFALGVFRAPDWTPYPGRRRAAEAVAYLRSTLMAVVDDRRRGGEARDDLVALLLAAADPASGRTMSNEEITDNLLTFVSAGHETTALGLAWTFYLLAQHPDVETRMLAEITAVTGGGPVRPEHVPALTYGRQVFSEAMRLYPPAPIITRTATRAFRLGDFEVPARAVLFAPIYAVHRHTSLWEDPERFDPERFAPEQVKQRHRYAYMPFGAGPRVCIGAAFATLEAVAILAVLLRAVALRRVSDEPPAPVMKLTLRPGRRLIMRVRSRGGAAAIPS